ncbi:uncharacterized protein LOC132676164 isoform X3 [Panthera onca]
MGAWRQRGEGRMPGRLLGSDAPPPPGLQGNCEQRAGGSGGGMGWGPEPGSLAGANTSSRLARPPLDTPLAPHTLPVGGPSPAPRPKVHPGGLAWRRKGWRWGREAGMWARRWAARSAMPGACLSLHQSPKWGERLQQTPASARQGLKGRAAIAAAAAAAAAVACAAENRLEMDSAGARDGVRGCSRRQYLPAGASRAAQPSPTLLLLPPLLRPGWRWMVKTMDESMHYNEIIKHNEVNGRLSQEILWPRFDGNESGQH